MEDTLISLETAKLAKEGGFPQCENMTVDESANMDFWEYGARAKNPEWKINGYGEAATDIISAPTQSLLAKWLREKHGIHILIIPTVTFDWTYKTITVISERDNDVIKGIKSISDLPPYKEVCGYDFSTYEEALEEGLQAALKLLPQKEIK